MSMTLEYNYAAIDPVTFRCGSCGTYSYQVPLETYIEVPYPTDDYIGKYYNLNGDQMWYWDAEFTQLWEECPSHAE